ncbi:MAG: aromatic amino acid lyase, partial [Armatimonadetes bacterium]|nr:aromatic amino acid lyase [Armatimonadota bacterium]
MTVEIGEHLTIEDVVKVARERAAVALSHHARGRVERSRAVVERLAADARPIYGI